MTGARLPTGGTTVSGARSGTPAGDEQVAAGTDQRGLALGPPQRGEDPLADIVVVEHRPDVRREPGQALDGHGPVRVQAGLPDLRAEFLGAVEVSGREPARAPVG